MHNLEFDMFSFFELTPDLVCIASKDGFFRKVNNAVINKLEYTEAELFAAPVSSFQHEDDREITAKTRTKMLEGTSLINFENRYMSKTGKCIWLHWTSVYIPDKELVFAIAKDVTERKLAEKEKEEKFKKFEGLATHFKANLEKERKKFAFDLHEEVAQLASAIKLDLDMVKSGSASLTPFLKSRVENASEVSRMLINKIRKISFSLSPFMLEQFGLTETLQWLCDEFATINKIPCSFHHKYNEAQINHEMKLDFFRICQETLSNVMRHANANNVKISIEDIEDKICLTITDDGVGFDKSKQEITSGFTNMKELAVLLNGELDIASSPAQGTTVYFTVPQGYSS